MTLCTRGISLCFRELLADYQIKHRVSDGARPPQPCIDAPHKYRACTLQALTLLKTERLHTLADANARNQTPEN